MSSDDEALHRFLDAGIEWAAGARGQFIVDAAAQALCSGIDSPALRMLAGAPARTADDEAVEFAPLAFEELGLAVHERRSPEALVELAQLTARRFLVDGGSPRPLAADIWTMSVAAGYPSLLADWSGLDGWYTMLDDGLLGNDETDADTAVTQAAQALVDGRRANVGPFTTSINQRSRRQRLQRFLRRKRRDPL